MVRNYHHIELLRIIACFAVIVIHVSGSNLYGISVNTATWQVFNIYDSLARFSVPCFMMISGMFLLAPNKPITVKENFTKRIRRLVVIWVVWRLFYAIVDFIWRKDVVSPAAIITLFKTFLAGHYHLWYLSALICIYLATPVLRALISKLDRKSYGIFMISLLIFGVIKAVLMPHTLPPLLQSIINLPGYAGYYIFGYYLITYPLTKLVKNIFFLLGIGGALSTIIFEYICSMQTGSTSDVIYDFMSLPVMLMGISVFLVFNEYVSKIIFSDKSKKIITGISSCTFGIYLLHAFVIERIYNTGFTTLSFNPVISVPIISASGFLISWVIVYILRRIPVARKYLV